jgi:hypothetical protein
MHTPAIAIVIREYNAGHLIGEAIERARADDLGVGMHDRERRVDR